MKRLSLSTALSMSMVLVACSGSKSANPGDPSSLPSPNASVRAVVVTSSSSGASTFQMHARADLSDGSSSDVTTISRWETSNSGLAAISTTGVLTALGSGQVEVRAIYQGVTGTMGLSVSVPSAPTTFTVSGIAAETAPASKPLAGVRVEITDGPDAGRSTTSDSNGAFRLDGLTKGVVAVLAEKSGYLPWRVSNFTVDRDYQLEVKLYPTPPKDANGVDATARCQDGTWSWEKTFAEACSANGGILYTVCPGPICK